MGAALSTFADTDPPGGSCQPILQHFNVRARLELGSCETAVSGSEALIERILLNLVTSLITAFRRRTCDVGQRTIRIATIYDGEVKIMVEGNAGGGEILSPGVTRWTDGPAFDLTAARGAVSDLGGRLSISPLRTDFPTMFVWRL